MGASVMVRLNELRGIIRRTLTEALLLEGMTVEEFEAELQQHGLDGDLARELKDVQDRMRTRAGAEIKQHVQDFFGGLSDRSWFRKPPADDNIFAWWLTAYRRAPEGIKLTVAEHLEGFLGGLNTSTGGEERRAKLQGEAIVERMRVNAAGAPKEIEILVPLSHPSAVMCSDRVGGSTWCNTGRGASDGFDDYASRLEFGFIVHQVSPRAGKPEPMQISMRLTATDGGEMKLMPAWRNLAEIQTASQEESVGWSDVKRHFGIAPGDLESIYERHSGRINRFLADTKERVRAERETWDGDGRKTIEGVRMSQDLFRAEADGTGNVFSRIFTGCTFEPDAFHAGFAFDETCSFVDCDMRGLDVRSLTFGATFESCGMEGAKLHGGEATFRYCRLAGASFTPNRAGELRLLDIRECSVGNVDFGGAKLVRCRISDNHAASEPAFTNVGSPDEQTRAASDIDFDSIINPLQENRRWLELSGIKLLEG